MLWLKANMFTTRQSWIDMLTKGELGRKHTSVFFCFELTFSVPFFSWNISIRSPAASFSPLLRNKCPLQHPFILFLLLMLTKHQDADGQNAKL